MNYLLFKRMNVDYVTILTILCIKTNNTILKYTYRLNQFNNIYIFHTIYYFKLLHYLT